MSSAARLGATPHGGEQGRISSGPAFLDIECVIDYRRCTQPGSFGEKTQSGSVGGYPVHHTLINP